MDLSLRPHPTPLSRHAASLALLLVVVLAGCVGARPARERSANGAPTATRTERPLVFAAFYERGPAWDTARALIAQPTMREHVAHHEALGERLIAAAPFAARPGDPAVGMVVFSAPSADEARQWLERDPAVVSGVMRATLRRWGVRGVRAAGAQAP